MSLMRLLTLGHCLNGWKQTPVRYRIKVNLLPKFGPANASEPMAHAAVQEKQSETPVVHGALSATTESGQWTADSVQPAQPIQQEIAPRSAADVGRKKSLLSKALGKINPFSERPRQSAIPKFSAKKSVAAPVQTELSLDNVRVMRNDLTDADLELVPKTSGVPSERSVICGKPRATDNRQLEESLV